MHKSLLLLLVLISEQALAAGDGGHGSWKDLIAPAVNFTILASFLAWKLGPIFKKYFVTKHEEIKSSAERAKTLKFEAEMKLEQQEKKNATLSKTLAEIKESAEEEITKYKAESETETQQRIAKLKEDAESKVEMQKKEFLSQLNNEVINQIVVKAKDKVASNPQLKEKITDSLLEGIR